MTAMRLKKTPSCAIARYTRDPERVQAAAALKDRSELSIAGTLTYQACDDTLCFTPQSVPLTWTIGLRALDRERANPRQ